MRAMPRVSDEHLAARRQQILDAARACFLRNGFHATSMQDVIGEAGLSVGAVYRYFKSKNEHRDRHRRGGDRRCQRGVSRSGGPGPARHRDPRAGAGFRRRPDRAGWCVPPGDPGLGRGHARSGVGGIRPAGPTAGSAATSSSWRGGPRRAGSFPRRLSRRRWELSYLE